jgi:tetratricopeptide (TPR) repeat protein
MFLKRFSSLALVAAIVIAVAGLGESALCAEAATQEQNLALLKEIEADLAKKPDNTLFQLQHAEVLGLLKRYDEQIAEANVVIKKYPKLRDAYLIRSDGQTNLKMYAEAIVSLDMAFKLAAPTPKLLLAKVRCLMNSERYSEAIAALNKIVEAEPSNATAFDRRSLCYFSLYGPCEQALRDMEKVVSLRPSDASAKEMVARLKRELTLKTSRPAR